MKSKLSRFMLGSLTAGIAGGQLVGGSPVAAVADAGGAADATDEARSGTAGAAPIASSGTGVAAVPACPGAVCLYEHNSYGGRTYRFTPPNADSDYTNGSPDWKGTEETINDQVSSYQNHSNHWVKFWQDDHYGDDSFCAGPGASSTNLHNFWPNVHDYDPNDSFSSHQSYASRPGGCSVIDTN